MTSARANLLFGPLPYRDKPSPVRPTSRRATEGPGNPEVAALGARDQQQLVLGALVEVFGGEVTAAALARHLSRQLGRTQRTFGPGLMDVLQALQGAGAVSLEANGKDDAILRLLPDGAGLCA